MLRQRDLVRRDVDASSGSEAVRQVTSHYRFDLKKGATTDTASSTYFGTS